MSIFDKLFNRAKPIETPWVTYQSEAGFYTIQHPADWVPSLDGNIVNISTPDGIGAITISAMHGTPPMPNFVQQWLADTFAAEQAMTEVESVSFNGWHGIRQCFMSSGADQRVWIGTVAVLEPVFILITANDTPHRIGTMQETYLRILNSLQIFQPYQTDSHGSA